LDELYNLHQYDEAKSCYADVLKLDMYSIDALLGLGYVYYSKNDMNMSIKIANRVLEHEPNNPQGKMLWQSAKKDKYQSYLFYHIYQFSFVISTW
jgi:tetratricopeptide (TPR) repeat protein